MESAPDGPKRTLLLDKQPRLSDLQLADRNGDGRKDFTVCAYGNYVGKFAWYQDQGGDRYAQHLLLDKPGALACRIVDVDADGDSDLLVLVAQALESMLLYLNDGRGHFEVRTLFQQRPSWGHASFDYADVTGDGRPDLIVANGDNADFTTAPPKSYHGVRIYRNEGSFKFVEAWFAPIHGAYKVLARDFDGDNDADLAVASFFPDYDHSPRESFVFFRNQGGLKCEPSTFRECIAGRCLTLDAGDIDGDGDLDLALGSLTEVPSPVPDSLEKSWADSGPSVMILRNDRNKAVSQSVGLSGDKKQS